MSAGDHIFNAVAWEMLPPMADDPNGLPHATHSGVLTVASVVLHCYQLSDGRRVLDADDVRAMLGGMFT